jgi:1-acyl-sn-glycerol-3-phosphate acyltransferase
VRLLLSNEIAAVLLVSGKAVECGRLSAKIEDTLVKTFYCCGRFLIRTILKVFFRLRVYGLENIPPGPGIIAPNHQSYIDPLVIGAGVQREIWYLAREGVFHSPPLCWIPRKINSILIKRDQADRAALKAVFDVLSEKKKIVIFPEGTRSPDGRLQAARRGIGLLAHKSGAPVIPAYVSGTYNVLPRGAHFVRRHPVSVWFGPYLRFDKRSLSLGVRPAYEAFGSQVMKAIASLKPEPDA